MRLVINAFNLGLLVGPTAEAGAAAGAPACIRGVARGDIDRLRDSLRRLAERASDRQRDAVLAEMIQAGGELFDWSCFGRDAARRDGATCQIAAQGSPYDTWKSYEHLPFEAARDAGGPLVRQNRCTVRVFDAVAPPPLVIGSRPLRVLLVAASPRGNAMQAADESVRLLGSLFRGLPNCELQVLEGPGTRRRLAELPERRWDVVHIVAHGTRANGTICLETPEGGQDFVAYEDFASELSRAVDGVRLVTLAVCDSSPLAVELAHLLRGVHVLALLAEMKQETLPRFFLGFYTRLTDWRGRDATRSGGSGVEAAFAHAAAGLFSAGGQEWFLPVLYAPAERTALFDFHLAAEMDRVAGLARAGKLVPAREEARGLLQASDPGLRRWAGGLLADLQRLIACEENLKDLGEEIRKEAQTPAPDWAGFHDRWSVVALDVAPTGGVRVVQDPNVRPQDLSFLQGLFQVYLLQAQRAMAALRELKLLTQEGPARLLAGCRGLLEFFQERREDLTPPSDAFLRGVQAQLRGIDALLGTADGTPPGAGRLEAVGRALEMLAGTESVIADAGGDLLPTARAAEARAGLDRVLEAVRARLSAREPDGALDPALLAPGRRLELLRLLHAEPGAAPPSTPVPGDIAGLRALVEGELAGSAGRGRSAASLREVPLTALANERAPLWLVDSPEQALHPFLLLGGYGVHADSSADEWRRVETAITGEDAGPAGARRIEALAALTLDRERLGLDILALPCDDAEELTRRLQAAAALLLEGRPIPAELFDGLSGTDRAGLTAAVGRTGEAADAAALAAVQGGTDRSRAQLERVRAAYLLAAHDARRMLEGSASPPDLERFLARTRSALALLGILDTHPALASWIGLRFAVYGSVHPDEVDSLARAVRQRLRSRIEEVIQVLETRWTGHAETVRTLRDELEAELRGARAVEALGVARPGLEPLRGGYLAALALGYLGDVGERLRLVYQRLAGMTHADYVLWAAERGLTKDSFHELVFAFSGLRRALVDPSAAHALRRRLPDTRVGIDEGEMASVADLLADRDGFPLHARLPGGEAEAALSAHLALLIAGDSLRETRAQFAKPRRNRGALRSALGWIGRMETYLKGLGYQLAGEVPTCSAALADICVSWMQGIIKANEEREDGKDPEADQAWKAALDLACQIADELPQWHPGVLAGAFVEARAGLHAVNGIFLANVFQDGGGAHRHLLKALASEKGNILRNFLVSAQMRGAELALDFRPAEAEGVLEEALRLGRDYSSRHPSEGAGVAEEILKTEAALRAIRSRSAPPSPRKVERL